MDDHNDAGETENGPITNQFPAPEPLRLVPDRRYTVAAFGALAVAVFAVLEADDGPTRLIVGIAVAILAAYALGDVLFSPRIEATADGLVIRSPLTRARLRWDEVDHVRADVTLRHGIRATTLEVDAGPLLVVLSKRAIGIDPELAAELIRARRPLTR